MCVVVLEMSWTLNNGPMYIYLSSVWLFVCVCVFVWVGAAEAAGECGSSKTGQHGQAYQATVQTGASRSDHNLTVPPTTMYDILREAQYSR